MKKEFEELFSKIYDEISSKYDEHGEFLSELTSHSPHLYRKSHVVMNSYARLLARLAKSEIGLEVLKEQYAKIKKLENALYHEVHSRDTGSH